MEYREKEEGITIPGPFKKLILEYNVGKPGKNEFSNSKELFFVENFLGLTKDSNNDFFSINNQYEGRIHPDLLIIAKAENGDFVLIDSLKHEVYFWNHELNDLGYSEESSKPTKISNSLDDFVNSLQKETEVELKKEDVISVKVSSSFNEKFKKYLKKE